MFIVAVGNYNVDELKAKLNIEAHAFSASAKEKIESLGGTIKEIKV
ncbi:MAG: uL15m family ribosomal protein [Candidatus Bathyarchaeia archaeon]